MDPCNPEHRPAPGERAMLDLGPDERFVVAALRAWVAPLMHPDCVHPDWQNLFRLAGVAAPAAVAFDQMMSVVASSAQRVLEVRCCRCPTLGADECAMLRLIAALQAGDTLGALDVLPDWLPSGAIAPALRGAQRFAALTATMGLRLPVSVTAPAHQRLAPKGATLH